VQTIIKQDLSLSLALSILASSSSASQAKMRDSSSTSAATRSSSFNSQQQDFNHGTWMSLLGLLNPLEFFVTVDKTSLWRRHVAWAKPNGKEIRDYTTQQFASNIVFLSLLLGSEMAVFLNSSSLLTQIRKSMEDQDYRSLDYYIGCVIIIDICVTILGLVATFTAWSMIAALSDSNSHAILRSSMGQYVTSLPMRLVVASLYLFLLWIVLLIMTLMKGPVPYIIVATVGFMFFQMVSSLSCFGRLIIHTGAMGQKRVLDPEFERHLLPSGLHASLLIKATERARRCTSATAQYQMNTLNYNNNNGTGANKTPTTNGSRNYDNPRPLANLKNNNDSIMNDQQRYMPPLPPTHDLQCNRISGYTCSGSDDDDDDDKSLSEEDHSALLLSARAFGSKLERETGTSGTATQSSPLSQQQHQLDLGSETVESCDDLCQDVFPRPSALNRVQTTQLKSVVKQGLDKTSQSQDHQHNLRTVTNEARQQVEKSRSMRKLAKERQEASFQGVTKSTAVAQLRQEWTDEEQVRNLYGYEPPVQVDLNDDADDNEPSDFKFLPRISLLNRSTRLQSLRNLLTFRGNNDDSIDDDDAAAPGEDHDRAFERIDGHAWLRYVEESGDETESSRDSLSSRNSVSSGMDAAMDNDSKNVATSCSTLLRNSNGSALSTVDGMSAGSNNSTSNTVPLLQSHDDQEHYPYGTVRNNKTSSSLLCDEDEETGTTAQGDGYDRHDHLNTEAERRHLLAPR
jgi:hypothetical protein